MKKFFKIETEYKFEWNDLRALLQIVNVMLIVFAGFNVGAVFGLIIGGLGLLKDLLVDRHINGIILHLAGIALNIYILCMQVGPDGSTLFYCGIPSDETDIRLVVRLVRESAFIRLDIRLGGLKTFS